MTSCGGEEDHPGDVDQFEVFGDGGECISGSGDVCSQGPPEQVMDIDHSVSSISDESKVENSGMIQERKKIVLKRIDKDHFDVLPEGWIEVTHHSGMPVYLHKESRVCCMSKPYHLGPGSARKHRVPVAAIPCLSYRNEKLKQALEEEKQRKILDQQNEHLESNSLSDDQPLPGAVPLKCVRIESLEETRKKNSLNWSQIREYCSSVFEFQEATIRKFKTWKDRRAHNLAKKIHERPSLPIGTKLITCPLIDRSGSDGVGRNYKREFVMNPAGKSSICILHEFIQHTQRVQPKYIYRDLENAATPYSATVVIDNKDGQSIKYATGYGVSKKQAKLAAAAETLKILIPDLNVSTETKGRDNIKEMRQTTVTQHKQVVDDPKSTSSDIVSSQPSLTPEKDQNTSIQQPSPSVVTLKETMEIEGVIVDSVDRNAGGEPRQGDMALDVPSRVPGGDEFTIFDNLKVTDSTVGIFCATAGQYSPYQILVECLKRNHGIGDTDIEFKQEFIDVDTRKGNSVKNWFTMTAGKHKVKVCSKNKRDGKQIAAQQILQLIHPQIHSFGSLLRLYGRGSCLTPKEKKEEEQKITELQSAACPNRPNYAILNKLQEEMIKLHQFKTMDILEMEAVPKANLENVDL